MANSQFQQFFLIFFEGLGLNWRKIDNRIKVRIWVLNQIIVIVITIFLLLQPKSTAITTHDSTSHWWRWLQHFTSCNARASYFSSSVPMSEKNRGTLKMRDMKLRHQTARVENARHENAAPECKGGKCET